MWRMCEGIQGSGELLAQGVTNNSWVNQSYAGIVHVYAGMCVCALRGSYFCVHNFLNNCPILTNKVPIESSWKMQKIREH